MPRAVPLTRSLAEANRQHLVDTKTYDTFQEDVHNALRAQLLAAVPDTFTAELKVPRVGYTGVTLLALLTHLWAN
jgi:hypothetical protein